MKHINFSKYLKKFQITLVYLCKYIAGFKNKNFFYYACLEEIRTLQSVLHLIDNSGSWTFSREQYNFIKDIARTKKIQYGKFEYIFKEGVK